MSFRNPRQAVGHPSHPKRMGHPAGMARFQNRIVEELREYGKYKVYTTKGTLEYEAVQHQGLY